MKATSNSDLVRKTTRELIEMQRSLWREQQKAEGNDKTLLQVEHAWVQRELQLRTLNEHTPDTVH